MDVRFQDTDLTGKIIGCAMRVHNELGAGFPEVFYQQALEIEFQEAGIAYSREHEMPVYYKANYLGVRRVDFLVADKISVELKALITLENAHLAQAMNYLEAYNLVTGLLINFGAPRLQFHRLTNKKLKEDNRSQHQRLSQNPTSQSHPTLSR